MELIVPSRGYIAGLWKQRTGRHPYGRKDTVMVDAVLAYSRGIKIDVKGDRDNLRMDQIRRRSKVDKTNITHSTPGDVVVVWNQIRLRQVSEYLHCAVPTLYLVFDIQLEPGQQSNDQSSRIIVSGGKRGGRRGKIHFRGKSWYTFHGRSTRHQEESTGWSVIRLYPPLDLLDLRRHQPSVRMLQRRPEVHLLRMLEELPQQGSVPVNTESYKGDIKPLWDRQREDATHNTCPGSGHCNSNGAITGQGHSGGGTSSRGCGAVSVGHRW